MKIVSYNVNGLRQRIAQFGSLRNLLNSFDADILCFQETKLRRQELTADLIMADGYESFFSCTRTSQKGRTGYSGVITFCRVKSAFSSTEVALPLAAEEGFTGLLVNSQTSKDELPFLTGDLEEFSKDELISLDSEGRCIITDHTHFVLFNVYGPRAASDDIERIQFKQKFYSALQRRWESLLHQGRRIFVVGDLNIAPFANDRCDAGPDFENNEFRKWFKSMLLENGGQFFDVFRAKHPDSPHRWKGGRSIKLEGSDHAPVFMTLHEISEVSLHSTPSLSARYVPMVHGIQQTLVSVLTKRKVSEQMKSCKMALEDIAIDSSCEGEEPVNRADSSATGRNECHFRPSQDYEGSILKPNELSRCSSQEVVSKSVNESEKSIIHKCNKPNKKARNRQWSQLSLRSFFQKSTNLDSDINGSSYTDYSNSQAEPVQPNPRLHETPTVSDHSISPKQGLLDTDARDQDLAGPKDSSTKEEKSNMASLEWQRIQQLMQNSIPICKGHKEPCIARVVKKQGPNFGRRFYVCARAEGPASNPEANCGYFGWASSKKSSSKSRNK